MAQHTLCLCLALSLVLGEGLGVLESLLLGSAEDLGFSVPLCFFFPKWNISWVSEMARQVRALTAKLENLSLNPVSVGVPGRTNHEERTPKSE